MAYQQSMNNLSHNMANVNTNGYKAARTSFQDLMYTNMNLHHNYDPNATTQALAEPDPVTGLVPAQTAADQKFMTGHGVRAAGLDLLFGQGNVISTNNQLDVAIEGDGLFAIEKNGARQYTRNGAFDISLEGKKGYLVTSDDGAYVLDNKGKRIQLTQKPGTKLFDLNNLTDKLGVYTFSNPYALERTTGTCFTETTVSGPATAVKQGATAPCKLEQNYLEGSGVVVADEMVNVMTTQRAFQMNGKMVQTADQLEEIINNLR